MPFGVNDLTVGLEHTLAGFFEARLQQTNFAFEDAQAMRRRHLEGSTGRTISVRRRSLTTPHDCPGQRLP